MKHENGWKAIPGGGDQAQGCAGGNWEFKAAGERCTEWISGEEGLLGRLMETQRPEVMP